MVASEYRIITQEEGGPGLWLFLWVSPKPRRRFCEITSPWTTVACPATLEVAGCQLEQSRSVGERIEISMAVWLVYMGNNKAPPCILYENTEKHQFFIPSQWFCLGTARVQVFHRHTSNHLRRLLSHGSAFFFRFPHAPNLGPSITGRPTTVACLP